jgi:hypothetical protein
MNLVQSVPSDHAVILGGDLNANWTVPWAAEFRDNSGLTDVFVERPDPEAIHRGRPIADWSRVDYIYYRGPYSVYKTQMRDGYGSGTWPGASDHPYVFAHLLRRSIPQQPDTTITSGPSGSVSATTASFAFSSSEAGSTFECSLDGAPFGACTSPKDYPALANGEHTFRVRAIGAGGTDPTPASRTWTVVDTAAPQVTSTTPPADATGVAPGVNVTATFSEAMMGTSINGTTFKLMKAGTTTAIAAVVSYDPTTKKATLDPTNNLRLGTKYKAVVSTGAKDAAGNALDQDGSLSGSQPRQWVFTVRK